MRARSARAHDDHWRGVAFLFIIQKYGVPHDGQLTEPGGAAYRQREQILAPGGAAGCGGAAGAAYG